MGLNPPRVRIPPLPPKIRPGHSLTGLFFRLFAGGPAETDRLIWHHLASFVPVFLGSSHVADGIDVGTGRRHIPMPTNCLSDAQCKSAKPRAKAYKIFDGHGLHLAILPSGVKSWRMAYRLAGKPQTATIGPYPLVTLAVLARRRYRCSVPFGPRLHQLAGQRARDAPVSPRRLSSRHAVRWPGFQTW